MRRIASLAVALIITTGCAVKDEPRQQAKAHVTTTVLAATTTVPATVPVTTSTIPATTTTTVPPVQLNTVRLPDGRSFSLGEQISEAELQRQFHAVPETRSRWSLMDPPGSLEASWEGGRLTGFLVSTRQYFYLPVPVRVGTTEAELRAHVPEARRATWQGNQVYRLTQADNEVIFFLSLNDACQPEPTVAFFLVLSPVGQYFQQLFTGNPPCQTSEGRG